MLFTLLGTGSSAQLPVYNCQCPACERARADSSFIRRPASAMLQIGRDVYLFDSGLMDLRERFPVLPLMIRYRLGLKPYFKRIIMPIMHKVY